MTKDEVQTQLNSGGLFMIGLFKSVGDIRELSGKSTKTGRDYHVVSRVAVIEQESTGRTVDVEISDDEAKAFVAPKRMARVLVQVWHAATGQRGYEIKARSIRPIE
jgi:hypothetical protein